MLAGGYVATYEAGFRKGGKRVVSERYTGELAGLASDERAGASTHAPTSSGAAWFTFMTYSDAPGGGPVRAEAALGREGLGGQSIAPRQRTN